jgi:hypothetical protein
MGFSVDFDGVDEFYMFVVLVFGLRTDGQVLGRLLKPVIMAAWASGARLLIYIDDGHGLAKTAEQAEADYALVLCLLVSAGFFILLAKSDGPKDAARSKEYLGFIIHTSDMSVHVPSHKMVRVVALLDQFLLSSWRSC